MARKDATVTQMRLFLLQVKLPSNQTLRLVGRKIIWSIHGINPCKERSKTGQREELLERGSLLKGCSNITGPKTRMASQSWNC